MLVIAVFMANGGAATAAGSAGRSGSPEHAQHGSPPPPQQHDPPPGVGSSPSRQVLPVIDSTYGKQDGHQDKDHERLRELEEELIRDQHKARSDREGEPER